MFSKIVEQSIENGFFDEVTEDILNDEEQFNTMVESATLIQSHCRKMLVNKQTILQKRDLYFLGNDYYEHVL